MAEKNTESTAVNELIELVQGAQPLRPDPSDDLMFREARPKKKVSAARMTATVPPVRGAGPIEPLPRARTPHGTQPAPTLASAPVRVTTAPPARTPSIPPLTLDDGEEVTNPGPARATGASPIAQRVTVPTLPPPVPPARPSGPRPSLATTRDFAYPVVQPTPPARSTPAPANMPVAAPFESGSFGARMLADRGASWIESDIGTQQVAKTHDWKAIAGKLIAPMIVLVIAGIFIGGYFAFDGDGGKRRKPKAVEGPTISMAVTQDEPAAAPAAAAPGDVAKTDDAAPDEAPAANDDAAKADAPANADGDATNADDAAATAAVAASPAPVMARPRIDPAKLVDVRIDSDPSGATVMLVDRGKTTFLGTTPMSAALDASRKYELVFSRERRATVTETLDPATQKRVSVKLRRASKKARAAAAKSEPAPKPAEVVEAPKPVRKSSRNTIDTATLAEPKAAAKLEGTLKISTKPPCEIVIDGKHTGLTTPQRAISLPVGAHKVTLVNGEAGIKKTISVKIAADKPTTVIQDFMK